MSDMQYIGQVYGHIPNVRECLVDEYITYPSFVGLELELEGVSHGVVMDGAPIDVRSLWRFELDGSLRGRNFEAIFKEPLAGVDVTHAVTALCSHLEQHDKQLRTGHRTSTHVHVDARDLSPDQLQKMVVIYIIFERALFHYAGHNRANNNFCMPMGNYVDLLRGISCIGSKDWNGFDNCIQGIEKYSALNLRALREFGSVEFRQFPGCYDRDTILTWIDMLLCLKRWAVESRPELNDIPQYLSGMGVAGLIGEVFPAYTHLFNYPEVERDCYYGIRRAQDIIYATNNKEASRKLLAKVREAEGEPLQAPVAKLVQTKQQEALARMRQELEDNYHEGDNPDIDEDADEDR